jgi:hypothetical protein
MTHIFTINRTLDLIFWKTAVKMATNMDKRGGCFFPIYGGLFNAIFE